MNPYNCISMEYRVGMIEVVLDAETIANIQKEKAVAVTSAFRKGSILGKLLITRIKSKIIIIELKFNSLVEGLQYDRSCSTQSYKRIYIVLRGLLCCNLHFRSCRSTFR